MAADVPIICAPRMTMPSSRSSTIPGYRNGSGWRWAGFERSTWGGVIA